MKNFNEIYERIYGECSIYLEQARKEKIKKLVIINIPIILIGIFLMLLLEDEETTFYLIIIVILLISKISTKSFKKSIYNSTFKNKVIRSLVKEYNKDFEYIPSKGIPQITYMKGNFEKFDTYYSEDLIYGLLESKYTINMAEVKTEKESTDYKGRRSKTTVFEGLFAEIYLDKNINANILIRENSLSLFGNDFKLEMDSGEFEKIFNVYSTNKIIAMQLLTSDVMEFFIDFKNKNKITPEVTLEGNKLYIRFPIGNIFEAKVIRKALDYSTLKNYYDIINYTLTLTEKFIKNINETEV